MELSERNQQVIVERASGETLATVAARHGITRQRVDAIGRSATEFVNQVELDLMVARKTGEQCAYLIPYDENYQLAMAFSDWLIGRLRERDLKLKIETRRASNGIALLISDVTDYTTGGER